MSLIPYHLYQAWGSLRRSPLYSLLIVLIIGLGISVYIAAMRMFFSVSANPLENKNEKIFAVQLDSWSPYDPFWNSENIPYQVTYKDGQAFLKNNIATNTVLMYLTGFTVFPESSENKPFASSARATNNDFFKLFDVPFLYGGPWPDIIDQQPENVVVLTKALSTALFGEINSVGRKVHMNGLDFQVIGVTNGWHPRPKIHDLNNGGYSYRDSMYIPLSLAIKLEKETWGKSNLWQPQSTIATFAHRLKSECTWMQLWVELPSEESRQAFTQSLTQYIRSQKRDGRFQRPLKFAISKPSEWLKINQVVSGDTWIIVTLSTIFFLACLITSAVFLLIKFLRKNFLAGIHRALGATKLAIFLQLSLEAIMLATSGIALGIGLHEFWLRNFEGLQSRIEDYTSLGDTKLVLATLLALLTSILFCALPAWLSIRHQPDELLLAR